MNQSIFQGATDLLTDQKVLTEKQILELLKRNGVTLYLHNIEERLRLRQGLVNKRAGVSIRRIIFGLCLLAGIIVLAIIIAYTIKDNSKQVQLYSAQIDNAMSEKIAFINTVATGVSSGMDM